MTNPNPFEQRISETRRRGIERISDMSTKDTTVSGRSAIDGPGECLIDVLFPVAFGQRPSFTYGGELDEASLTVIQGQYPRVTAVISNWTVVNRIVGAFDGYFTGAQMAVVVDGIKGQRTWLHWSFRAPAIRNPVRITEDLTEML